MAEEEKRKAERQKKKDEMKRTLQVVELLEIESDMRQMKKDHTITFLISL